MGSSPLPPPRSDGAEGGLIGDAFVLIVNYDASMLICDAFVNLIWIDGEWKLDCIGE